MKPSGPEKQPEQAAATAARNEQTEAGMVPKPAAEDWSYRPGGKLQGLAALVSGGDSGIGRATAICFAKEGADVAILYRTHHDDARETRRLVEAEGRRCLALAGDVGDEAFCRDAVAQTVREFGKLDILVNNAGEQHPQKDLTDIDAEQLERTFRTNIFGYFFLAKAALPHLRQTRGRIINTASVTAYRGSPELIDYSATKGAIVSFTRSLSKSLAKEGIRVNGVAPGPIWTPLISSTFPPEEAKSFGTQVPLGRPGQPEEIAPSYVFLASDDSSYITGQIIHPNGGEPVES